MRNCPMPKATFIELGIYSICKISSFISCLNHAACVCISCIFIYVIHSTSEWDIKSNNSSIDKAMHRCYRGHGFISHCVVPENIHTPLTEGFFFGLDPHPSGNSSLGSYFSLKILPLRPPPSPSEFPMNLCGGGMDICWNHRLCLKLLTDHCKDHFIYFMSETSYVAFVALLLCKTV